MIQLVADVVHLLAAAAWIGAIANLAMMVIARADVVSTHRALDRLALAGTVLVGLVLASGLVNSRFLIGWTDLNAALDTLYGNVFLAKIVLFVAMLGVAAANRFRLTPALGKAIIEGRTYPAFHGLRLSLILELSLAAAILGSVMAGYIGTASVDVSHQAKAKDQARNRIRANARESIEALRAQGLRVIVRTGDNPTIAQIVAEAVGGLDGVHAELNRLNR